MKESEIFRTLLQEAEKTIDPEGAVAACLVRNGQIIAISPSAEDGVRHAEDLVIEMAREAGLTTIDDTTLITTLEPCSYRSPRNGVDDCATIILNSGIKRVVYTAPDPEFSKETGERFREAGVVYEQVQDEKIVAKSIDVFNGSITKPITTFGTKRQKTQQ